MGTAEYAGPGQERFGAELRRFGVEHGGERLRVVSPYDPAGDQPQAIERLAEGVEEGLRYQTLMGVTGSGKTFTMAKTIEALNRPTLIMEPNKTLAAQVASEMKEFFPNNAVVYFVSYYDYYQPEAYVPQTDTYIEKDSSINEEVEKLRHQATSSLLSRRDVIVVASVSCIYGIGSPQDYAGLAPNVDKEVPLERDDLIRELIDIQYDRNDYDLVRGTFRVRGDTVDVFPPYAREPPAHQLLRRRGGAHRRGGQHHGRDRPRVRRHPHLAGVPLRDGAPQGQPRPQDHQRGAGGPRGGTQGKRHAPGGPAPGPAHEL